MIPSPSSGGVSPACSSPAGESSASPSGSDLVREGVSAKGKGKGVLGREERRSGLTSSQRDRHRRAQRVKGASKTAKRVVTRVISAKRVIKSKNDQQYIVCQVMYDDGVVESLSSSAVARSNPTALIDFYQNRLEALDKQSSGEGEKEGEDTKKAQKGEGERERETGVEEAHSERERETVDLDTPMGEAEAQK
ncbi:hypothetical protein KIPB_010860 [Kipferlia bialata]|uniref:Uncharacterized protein n=1 Tax=Kipferlia bialata TaxID=797122 RepID=A0A9K3D761_9EUKA|nr:hypothetical protein KIPB_010860 [Kipferlia bialata]|eukprot:g10860.t1